MKFAFKKENLPPMWLDAAHFVNDIYTGMLNPIMPFIAVKLGISMAVATIVLSLSHICASLLQPIFGFFADNIIKRSFIFWGLLMSSVFISLAPCAHSLYYLIIFIILGSLGSSIFHPQALGFSVRFARSDASKNMGAFIGLGTVGFSLGPIVSAGVTQFLGLAHMPYLCIFGVLLAFVMFICIPKISNTGIKVESKKFGVAFSSILKNRKLNLLIVISILKTLVTTSSTILLPFLWKDLGRNPFYIGFALFAFTFAGGIGSLISGKIEQKFGTPKVFYVSLMATLPLMIAFAYTYKILPTIALCIYILMGLTTMMAMPITMVMAQSVIPDYKSIIGGFINGFSWGIVAIFMTGIGFIAQANGIIPVLLCVSLIPAVAAPFVINKLFAENKLKLNN
ncbi:MAG: MFS transporter [Clostridiaceae bacterium]|jgi:MFS transporter, FSR family, fosmidomycin resistance protein|nr:MFS transporter [Clostridiaceae bacterium]